MDPTSPSQTAVIVRRRHSVTPPSVVTRPEGALPSHLPWCNVLLCVVCIYGAANLLAMHSPVQATVVQEGAPTYCWNLFNLKL